MQSCRDSHRKLSLELFLPNPAIRNLRRELIRSLDLDDMWVMLQELPQFKPNPALYRTVLLQPDFSPLHLITAGGQPVMLVTAANRRCESGGDY